MVVRNDRAIADALEAMTHVTNQANQAMHNQNWMADEFKGLGKFQRNNLPNFRRRYESEGDQVWL